MAADNIVIITEQNFDAEVNKSTVPVLVDYWAEWCGPCKMIGPVLDQLAAEFAGKAKIAKVNIDECRDLAIKAGIRSIPTLQFYKGGEKVKELVGSRPKKELADTLTALLG